MSDISPRQLLTVAETKPKPKKHRARVVEENDEEDKIEQLSKIRTIDRGIRWIAIIYFMNDPWEYVVKRVSVCCMVFQLRCHQR